MRDRDIKRLKHTKRGERVRKKERYKDRMSERQKGRETYRQRETRY
jgi:hypothetical protein